MSQVPTSPTNIKEEEKEGTKTGVIKILFENQDDSKNVIFEMRQTAKIRVAIETYCKVQKISSTENKFLWDGENLAGSFDETWETLLEDEDTDEVTIYVASTQVGGYM